MQQVNKHYEMMEKDAKQSEFEAQTARDEVSQLRQTVDRLELELQVGHC